MMITAAGGAEEELGVAKEAEEGMILFIIFSHELVTNLLGDEVLEPCSSSVLVPPWWLLRFGGEGDVFDGWMCPGCGLGAL